MGRDDPPTSTTPSGKNRPRQVERRWAGTDGKEPGQIIQIRLQRFCSRADLIGDKERPEIIAIGGRNLVIAPDVNSDV